MLVRRHGRVTPRPNHAQLTRWGNRGALLKSFFLVLPDVHKPHVTNGSNNGAFLRDSWHIERGTRFWYVLPYAVIGTGPNLWAGACVHVCVGACECGLWFGARLACSRLGHTAL